MRSVCDCTCVHGAARDDVKGFRGMDVCFHEELQRAKGLCGHELTDLDLLLIYAGLE